jgi:hypothetical protein
VGIVAGGFSYMVCAGLMTEAVKGICIVEEVPFRNTDRQIESRYQARVTEKNYAKCLDYQGSRSLATDNLFWFPRHNIFDSYFVAFITSKETL